MANTFLVIFPNEFTSKERSQLLQRVKNVSWMILPRFTNKQQFEFMTADNAHTVESVVREFDIPSACQVIDTSHWDHS